MRTCLLGDELGKQFFPVRVGSDLPYGAWVSSEFTIGGQQCYPLDRSLGHEDAIEWVFVSGWQVINVDRMFARDR